MGNKPTLPAFGAMYMGLVILRRQLYKKKSFKQGTIIAICGKSSGGEMLRREAFVIDLSRHKNDKQCGFLPKIKYDWIHYSIIEKSFTLDLPLSHLSDGNI